MRDEDLRKRVKEAEDVAAILKKGIGRKPPCVKCGCPSLNEVCTRCLNSPGFLPGGPEWQAKYRAERAEYLEVTR